MYKNEKQIEYEIVDINESNKELYCHCLEDWSDEIKEAGTHKSCWYDKMQNRGLGVKLLKDKDNKICGMIQYIPSEYVPITGNNFYFIYCIWVHAHKKGIGDRRGQGKGSALLKAAEDDAKTRGAKGMACWGIAMPFWMKASWYKKHGYKVVQKDGIRRLLWKPFTENTDKPQWYATNREPESYANKGKVLVTSLINGVCPVANLAHERAKSVSQEFGERVVFTTISTDEPDIQKEWGASDALFINGKEIPLGPPLAKKKIRSIITKELKKAH